MPLFIVVVFLVIDLGLGIVGFMAFMPGATGTNRAAFRRIRALTAVRPITPTSLRCPSAWQLNPAEAPLIEAEKAVQTTGTTSEATK